MNIKITMFYQQQARGWTEQWTMQAAGLPTSFDGPANAVANAAVRFRGPSTALIGVRFSNADGHQSIFFSFPSPYISPIAYTGYGQSVQDANSSEDVVSTDAVWELRDTGANGKRIYLRGLRDSDVERDANGFDIPSKFLQDKVTLYFNAVYNAGWGWRYAKNSTNTPGWPSYNCATIQYTTDTLSTIAFSQGINLGPPINSPIKLLGFPRNNCPGIPKTCLVSGTNYTAAPFGLLIPYRLRNNTTVSLAKAKIVPLDYLYTRYNSSAFVRFSERKTGRAFGLPRGRSLVAIRRL